MINREYKIYIDVDGVIADFTSAYMQQCVNLGYCKQSDVDLSKIKEWSSLLEVTNTTHDQLLDICDDAIFIRGIQLYDQAYNLVGKIRQHFEHVAFLTAVACRARKDWLKTRFGDIPVIQSTDKYFLADPKSILIDDNDENCSRWLSNGGESILYPQPWNRMSSHSMDLDDKRDSVMSALSATTKTMCSGKVSDQQKYSYALRHALGGLDYCLSRPGFGLNNVNDE